MYVSPSCYKVQRFFKYFVTDDESVHSVCTGPVVLTGMTCTVIDICFYGDEVELKTIILY